MEQCVRLAQSCSSSRTGVTEDDFLQEVDIAVYQRALGKHNFEHEHDGGVSPLTPPFVVGCPPLPQRQ
jgi:hypothetical protein